MYFRWLFVGLKRLSVSGLLNWCVDFSVWLSSESDFSALSSNNWGLCVVVSWRISGVVVKSGSRCIKVSSVDWGGILVSVDCVFLVDWIPWGSCAINICWLTLIWDGNTLYVVAWCKSVIDGTVLWNYLLDVVGSSCFTASECYLLSCAHLEFTLNLIYILSYFMI